MVGDQLRVTDESRELKYGVPVRLLVGVDPLFAGEDGVDHGEDLVGNVVVTVRITRSDRKCPAT